MIPPFLVSIIGKGLAPKLAIAIAVVLLAVAVHWHGYSRGKAAVMADWNEEKVATQQAILEYQSQVRETERKAQETLNAITTQYSDAEAERLAALAAAGADHQRMRDELARARRRAAAAAARPEVDATRLVRAFDECTVESVRIQDELGAEVVRLGGVADGLAATVTGLQGWARMARGVTEGQ